MLTAPSTPSPALTVTGESPWTPTAPSVTDACSFGTNRLLNGSPLPVITCGAGGATLLPHALRISAATDTAAAAISQSAYRRRLVIVPTCSYDLRACPRTASAA